MNKTSNKKKKKPMVIWKFQLNLIREQYIKIPEGSSIVHLGVQNGLPCLWALVNPTAPLINLGIVVVGTGQKLPDTAFNEYNEPDYLGTVQLNDFVWHFFKRN